MNNVNVAYACKCKHRHNIWWVNFFCFEILNYILGCWHMIEIEKRTVQVKFRLPGCTWWFPVALAFCTRRIVRVRGNESWTTTTAGKEEMGRKNGDAVQGERKQENCGERQHLDWCTKWSCGKFGESRSYPEHDELLLTLPHVSGGRK